MARLKGWKGSGKSTAIKAGVQVYVNRGALVAASWPKKRGRPKSPITREQNEWFRQANQLAKYADDQAQWMAIEISKGSPWYPRDILISAMAGRLFETLNIDGVEFRSVAINDDVSSDLDFLAGKVTGTIIVRGANLWHGLVPGTAGTLLTSNGPAAEPSYQGTVAPGGEFYAANMPSNSAGGASFATRGNAFRVTSAVTIKEMGGVLTAVNADTYKGGVYKIDATPKITVVMATTPDITGLTAGKQSIIGELSSAVFLEPGTTYYIAWSVTDRGDTFPLPFHFALEPRVIAGLPENYFALGNDVDFHISLAKATPAVDDAVVITAGNRLHAVYLLSV